MSNKNFSAKAVRDGAMMTALSVIFMLMGIYVPFLSTLGMLLSGVPLAVLYFKDGLRPSVYAAVIASFILFFFTVNFLSSFLMMLAYGVPGLVAGICLKKRLPLYYSVFSVSGAFLIGFLCQLLSVKLFMGGIEDMFNQVFEMTEKSLETMLASMNEKNGGALAQNVDINDLMASVKELFKLYFPSMCIIVSVVSGYAIYCLSGYILKRLRIYRGEITPFGMIKAPAGFCNASAIILLISFFVKSNVVAAVLANIVFVLYFLIGAAGFSFVDCKIAKCIKKGYLRVLLYCAFFVFGAGLLVWAFTALILIGFLDSFMNFRNISEPCDE